MQGNYKGGYDGQKVLFKSWQSLAMSTLWQRERVSLGAASGIVHRSQQHMA